MEIKLKVLDQAEKDEWDDLVDRSAHGTIFHTWKFLRAIGKHTGSKLYPLAGFSGDMTVGLYPLFLKKKFFNRMVLSPPSQVSVPYLGPLLIDYDKLRQTEKEMVYTELQKVVDEYIDSELKADYVLINTPPGLEDSRPLKWNGYVVEPYYNYLIDLRNGIEPLWGKLEKKLRHGITNERDMGVQISEGSRKDLERIYGLLLERYGRQGKAVTVPKDYLLDVYDALYPANMKIHVMEYKNEFMGGLIDLYYKGKVCGWVGNPKPKLKNLSTDLLQWEAIMKACRNGADYYEEIGANTERLRHFKSKYNPELDVYFTAKKYISEFSKMSEYGYRNVIKPVLGKIGRVKK